MRRQYNKAAFQTDKLRLDFLIFQLGDSITYSCDVTWGFSKKLMVFSRYFNPLTPDITL